MPLIPGCSRCLLDQKRSFGQVEFTQLLRVGLGLADGLSPQYSHPVFTGLLSIMHRTINEMWENSLSTGYLLGNVYVGLGKMQECENHVNNVQMRQTDESWWMMSRNQIT